MYMEWNLGGEEGIIVFNVGGKKRGEGAMW